MKTTLYTLLSVGLLLILSAPSAAQTYYGPHYGMHPAGLQRPMTVYRQSSTVQEGYLRGLAALRSAHGEAAANQAYAAYMAELARAEAIENRQAAVEGYYNRRQLNRERRFGTAKAKAEGRAARAPVSVQPQRPTPEQFNADFLIIRWPAALQGEEYAADRAQLQQALAWRTRYNYGPGSDAHTAAQAAGRQMLAKLQTQVKTLPPMEYMACRRFVESLAWETRFAP